MGDAADVAAAFAVATPEERGHLIAANLRTNPLVQKLADLLLVYFKPTLNAQVAEMAKGLNGMVEQLKTAFTSAAIQHVVPGLTGKTGIA